MLILDSLSPLISLSSRHQIDAALSGKQVSVYWNLHKRTFSVEHGGRVVAHTPSIDLVGVRFTVAPKGNEKVRITGQKNVHARLRGVWIPVSANSCGEPVTYNPYKNTTFVLSGSGAQILVAESVSGVTVAGKPSVTAISYFAQEG